MRHQVAIAIKILFIFLLITIASFSLGAQQHQFSGWMACFNTIKLKNKFSLHFDGQLRSNDELIHTQTLLLRPGINFHLNKQVILTAGYAFINNRAVKNNTSGYFSEHRLWQQVILLQPVKNIFVQHRLRYEERFIPQTNLGADKLVKTGTAFATRFRYFARTILPLKQVKKFEKGWFTALQNEVFVNITNASATNNNFFDQNRAYAAAGYRFTKSFDAEAGFMNQYINGRTVNTSNNIIQLAAYLRL